NSQLPQLSCTVTDVLASILLSPTSAVTLKVLAAFGSAFENLMEGPLPNTLSSASYQVYHAQPCSFFTESSMVEPQATGLLLVMIGFSTTLTMSTISTYGCPSTRNGLYG